MAPKKHGRPGFLRVDTVHQSDKGGEKGIYIINVVDEVTQFQHLAAVPRITEHFLNPVLEALITAFPFTVLGFHADNGSEFINHRVAALLAKLHIDEFTKSRPRRSNDNALIEGKNGSIVRKWLGHTHIPRDLAPLVDTFLRDSLSPFLNFHRPCLFAVEVVGANGRVKRRYPPGPGRHALGPLPVAARRRNVPQARRHVRGARPDRLRLLRLQRRQGRDQGPRRTRPTADSPGALVSSASAGSPTSRGRGATRISEAS